VSYDICDLGELENKKALNVLDKMSKFIKLSRYYKEWQTFKERMKANKEFDTNLKTFIKTMQGPGMKITTRRGRPSKIAATQAPKIAATQAPKIAATQAPKIAATPMRPVLTPVPISPVSKSREEQIQLVQKRITVTIKKRQ
jgi:hypothetical protein